MEFGYMTAVYGLDISMIDDRVAIGTGDGTVEIWDLALQTQLLDVIVTDADPVIGAVRFVDWSPDGSLLATNVGGRPGLIWDSATGAVILEFPNLAFGMTWSPTSDEFVAEIEFGGGVGIWNIRDERLRTLQDGDGLFSPQWSPDGNLIVGDYREQLYVWKADTGEVAFSSEAIVRPRRGNIEAIAWHPNSRYFALHTAQREGSTFLPNIIQIWSVEDFTIVYELEGIRSVEFGLRSVAWSHSGDRFAAVSGDGHLYVWDAETFELLNEYDGYGSAAPEPCVPNM
jgi:WD40 repeat protein